MELINLISTSNVPQIFWDISAYTKEVLIKQVEKKVLYIDVNYPKGVWFINAFLDLSQSHFFNLGYNVKSLLVELLDDIYLENNRRSCTMLILLDFQGGGLSPSDWQAWGLLCSPAVCGLPDSMSHLMILYFGSALTLCIWQNVVWIVWLEGARLIAVCAGRWIPAPFNRKIKYMTF